MRFEGGGCRTVTLAEARRGLGKYGVQVTLLHSFIIRVHRPGQNRDFLHCSAASCQERGSIGGVLARFVRL